MPMEIDLTTSRIADAASYYSGTITPGEVVTVYGSGLGPNMTVSVHPDSRGYVTTTLAGTQVLFDGVPAQVLYASGNQVSVAMPSTVSVSTSVQVQVLYSGQFSAPVTVPVSVTISNPLDNVAEL